VSTEPISESQFFHFGGQTSPSPWKMVCIPIYNLQEPLGTRPRRMEISTYCINLKYQDTTIRSKNYQIGWEKSTGMFGNVLQQLQNGRGPCNLSKKESYLKRTFTHSTIF
jgi:hypothetical protein